MTQKKRILDSVHGNIYIERDLFVKIIDTPEFQRLRRIEQTSTRSIFPSARHDRFIHSVGVYHIGNLITKQLNESLLDGLNLNRAIYDDIVKSYHIACLLHDIGHAPFSHTFEKYFGEPPYEDPLGKKVLKDDLLVELNDIYQSHPEAIPIDIKELNNTKCDCNFHELTSAIITVRRFKDIIPCAENHQYNNVEFVARMIIGCAYLNNTENEEVQIRNCFIDLLHGGIIDADRLDYVCRDVWASGYCTSSVDIERLISGLYIEKDESTNQYEVCFHSNVLNEIESVLDVKDFQVKYILNHHSVLLEQYFLEQAALQMALEFTNLSDLHDNIIDKEKALSSILRWKTLTEDGMSLSKIRINNEAVHIDYLTDDDLVSLMKLSGNDYYKKWAKRQYDMVALWKTKDEFFYHFKFPRDIKFGNKKYFTDSIMPNLKSQGFDDNDVLILKAKYKPRVELDSLKIRVATGKLIKYTDLYRENAYSDLVKVSMDEDPSQVFYYVYLNADKFPQVGEDGNINDRTIRREEIMQNLKSDIETAYKVHTFIYNMLSWFIDILKNTKESLRTR